MKAKGRILLLGIALFIVVMILLLLQSFVVQPQTVRSLFKGDTCSPPCWFGLIPGESTAEEVARFVNAGFPEGMDWQAFESREYESSTDIRVVGWYDGYWREFPDRKAQSNSVLRIYNGVFDSLTINLNREATFGEMLAVFGRPDVLRLGLNAYGFTYMIAIYENARFSVFIDMNPFLQAHVEPNEPCTFHDPANSFFVDGLDYFSPQAAQELVTPVEGDRVPQPRLLVRYLNEHDVPSEILSSWLNGEETADCRTVWERLAQAQATATPE